MAVGYPKVDARLLEIRQFTVSELGRAKGGVFPRKQTLRYSYSRESGRTRFNKAVGEKGWGLEPSEGLSLPTPPFQSVVDLRWHAPEKVKICNILNPDHGDANASNGTAAHYYYLVILP